ncbi:MAG: OB-fold domain-containing protein [Pseudomonadota bacterium]
MPTIGITGFGGYVPRTRISRASIAKANAWINPGLMAYSKSERTMCSADEDSVTMAVEAARNSLNKQVQGTAQALYFASTTFPFADRQNSTIVAEALGLQEEIDTLDVSQSQRAGTSGLIAAFKALGDGRSGQIIYVSADCRHAKTASVQELLFGDGAAALTLGGDKMLARFLGSSSVSRDFIDHFRADGAKFDHYFEERWIRDEGYSKIVPKAVQNLASKTGLKGSEVDHFIMPCIIRRVREDLVKQLGIKPEALRDDLSAGCGETGTAHPLLMLAHTLEEAGPGQKILVVGFGQGADALLFETTDQISSFSPRHSLKSQLAAGCVESNYQKYLAFKDMTEIEWGLRAEDIPKIRPSAAWRDHRNFNSLVGGRCRECSTVQFPSAHICVNPDCRARDSQDEYRLADSPAKVASFTLDRLAFTPNPPLIYGMIEFDEGAKLMMEFSECDPEKVQVGLAMEMVFRIKQNDKRRNFRNYFWKATPRTNA